MLSKEDMFVVQTVGKTASNQWEMGASVLVLKGICDTGCDRDCSQSTAPHVLGSTLASRSYCSTITGSNTSTVKN